MASNQYAVNLSEGLVPIEDFIRTGLQKQVATLFSCSASWVQSSDKKRSIQGQSPDGKITYPFLVLTLTDVSEQDSSFNAKYLALSGQPVALGRDGKTYTRVSFVPVQCNVAVEYYSNNAMDLDRFTNKWFFARKLGHLNFNVKFGRTTFSIQVQCSSSLSIPVREANPGETQEYVITTQLSMNSYLSSDAVTSDVLDEIQVSVAAATLENEAAAINDPNAQFWSFSFKG